MPKLAFLSRATIQNLLIINLNSKTCSAPEPRWVYFVRPHNPPGTIFGSQQNAYCRLTYEIEQLKYVISSNAELCHSPR